MASKTNRTPDGRHVQFGDKDTFNQPDDSTAPDNGAICPQWFGQIMEGGEASAYIESYD